MVTLYPVCGTLSLTGATVHMLDKVINVAVTVIAAETSLKNIILPNLYIFIVVPT